MLGNQIGHRIIELEETGSTNSFALKLLENEPVTEGTVIMAHFQSEGRGQRGASWESESHKNLLVSYILKPSFLPVSHLFQLSQALSVGLYEFIKSATEKKVSVKWPNDIMVGNDKIAGVLVENTIRNNAVYYSVTGMGININQISFSDYIPFATSLSVLEQKTFDLDECLLILNSYIEKWYGILRSGNYKKITDTYSDSLFRKDEQAMYEAKGVTFKGVIRGVLPSGQLMIEDENKNEYLFDYKEVKYLY